MKKIGEVIRYLRKSKNLSQEQLSDLIGCTREFISQVERDKCNLPEYLILPLSNLLNYDIARLIKNLSKYNNFNHYILSCELIDLIESKDNYKISLLLKNDTIVNEFNYGHPKILKLYCTALVEKYINKDIDKSTIVCLEQLELNSIFDVETFTPKLGQEYRYYSTILILGVNLHLINEVELHKILLTNTLNFLNQNIFNDIVPISSTSFFFKRYYIITLNNYSDILFNQQDYNNALFYCNEAISFATKYNIFFMVDLLLKLKVEILYNLCNFQESRETYMEFKYICRLVGCNSYYEASTLEFKTKYHKLFE